MHQQPLYDAWISATYLLLTAPFKNLRKLRIDITPSFDTERILDAYCRESLVNAIESLEYLDELVVTIGSAKSVPLFQGIHRSVSQNSQGRFAECDPQSTTQHTALGFPRERSDAPEQRPLVHAFADCNLKSLFSHFCFVFRNSSARLSREYLRCLYDCGKRKLQRWTWVRVEIRSFRRLFSAPPQCSSKTWLG